MSPAPVAKHSNLGPSSAERWWNCPGSVAAIAVLPRQGSSIHAAEGTVAHALCEEFVTGKLSLKALMARIGRVTEQDGFEIEVTEEMVEAVIQYKDLIDAAAKALAATPGPLPVVSKAEVRVYAASIDPLLYGTADHIMYKKGRKLTVTDFKYGKGVVVEVEGNKQAAIYAVAAMDTEAGPVFDEVEVVIHQPRAGGDAVRRWVIPKEWMARFRIDLKAAVERTKQADAPRVAGSWCRWCAAKATCPAALAEVQKQAMIDFADPVPAGLPDISSLSLETLTRAMDHEDYVVSWFEAARAHVRGLLEAGRPVPGFKLVEGKSNRKYIDEKAVISEFAPLLGEDALHEKTLLSPAKLEKITGKGSLDKFTFKPEGKKTVARADDPRPEAKNSAEIDFTAIVPAKKEQMWP